jgi:hypothetical protein
MGKPSHKKSRFYQAVTATPALVSAYCPGLKALQPADKAKIICRNSKKLTGSACLDKALKQAMPNDPRWDYAIGYQRDNTEEIVWAEVHPADSGKTIREVGKKLDWLTNWLAGGGQAMNYTPRRLVWVASGRSSFSNNDPKLRSLRQRGLEFAGGHLVL